MADRIQILGGAAINRSSHCHGEEEEICQFSVARVDRPCSAALLKSDVKKRGCQFVHWKRTHEITGALDLERKLSALLGRLEGRRRRWSSPNLGEMGVVVLLAGSDCQIGCLPEDPSLAATDDDGGARY
ncbi:hypothetical protein ACLOJK_022688 [Asimina triloba]